MATNKNTKTTTAKKPTAPAKKTETSKSATAKAPAQKPASVTTMRASSTTTTRTAPVQVSHEMIAREAYLLWQSRGGCEEENWLEAERLIRARNGAR